MFLWRVIMDWKAAMSSEIFREYVKNELIKEAEAKPEESVCTDKTLKSFEKLEAHINKTPELKKAFKTLQRKFAADPEYTSKVDPSFVDGVMMLFLDDKD
jgi:hypothetical protein